MNADERDEMIETWAPQPFPQFTELLDACNKPRPSNRKRPYFVASECGKCPRYTWMRLSGKMPPEERTIIERLEDGTAIHESLQFRMKALPGIFTAEHPGEINCPAYDVHYIMDGIWELEDGDEYGLEIKTTKKERFIDMTWGKGGTTSYGIVHGPQQEHAEQLNIGLHGEGLDKGILYYVCPDTGWRIAHLIQYNEEAYQATIDRFDGIWMHYINGTDPGIGNRKAFPNKKKDGFNKTKGGVRAHWQCMYWAQEPDPEDPTAMMDVFHPCKLAEYCWGVNGKSIAALKKGKD